jgi:hypothetical protein
MVKQVYGGKYWMVINGLSCNLGTIWISDSSVNRACVFYLQTKQVHSKYIDGGIGGEFQEIGRHYHPVNQSAEINAD